MFSFTSINTIQASSTLTGEQIEHYQAQQEYMATQYGLKTYFYDETAHNDVCFGFADSYDSSNYKKVKICSNRYSYGLTIECID